MVASISSAATLMLVCSVPALGQSTWYVDNDNCSGPGTGSQADPFCMIQAGIDAAADGDTVVVADGTYRGEGNRNLNIGSRLITVRSTGGPVACAIDCEAAGRAFMILGGARIEGFTLRNGHALGGGAMTIGGSPTIVGCVFEDNVSEGDGGAIYNTGGGNPRLINCLFTGNHADDLGGAIFSDLASFSMVNCALSDNTARRGGGIRNYAAVDMTLTNCILWGNQDVEGGVLSGQIESTSSSEIVNYSCIEGLNGEFGGEGNISLDPLWVDGDGGDYHVGPGSPCIDAGDSAGVPEDVTGDLVGNSRFVDDPNTKDTGIGPPPIVDMGAYEYQATGNPIPTTSDWPLMAMALLLMTAGSVVFRRMRVAA